MSLWGEGSIPGKWNSQCKRPWGGSGPYSVVKEEGPY